MLPHHNAERSPRRRWDNFDFPGGDFDFEVFAVVIAILVALLLLWFAVIPLLLVVFDLLVVMALFVFGLAARVLFRRPWTVVATRCDGVEIEREIVGWRASRAEVASLRRDLEIGSAQAAATSIPTTTK